MPYDRASDIISAFKRESYALPEAVVFSLPVRGRTDR